MSYALVKLADGRLRSCPTDSIDPTDDTDTCQEIDNDTWIFGQKTFARKTSGRKVPVEPLFFGGKLFFLFKNIDIGRDVRVRESFRMNVEYPCLYMYLIFYVHDLVCK